MKTDIRTRRRALFAGAAAPAIALALMATAAQAQEPAKAFSIAPQPLADALLQLSRQADVDIVASTDLTKGRTAPKVDGQMTTADAMSALLAGSGLVAAPSGTGYVITRASDPQSGSAAGDGADGTVQALIVTAQKREENIQDVPIAMSAFTQEDLTKSQVAGGPDLMTQVPNFTFTKTNFSGYSIQIRGIGTQAISVTTDPAVAVAFNNTPFVRNHFFEQEFYDLQRVEVLRGPQGTLYGRNATAGVVNIISAKPSNHFEARLSADAGNYNSTRFEGMINLPLVENKAALRIAGAWTKRDGYVKNILTGRQTDGRNLWSTRVTLGLTPTDAFDLNLIWEHFQEDDDRLRSGKQLCHADPGPSEINGVPVGQSGASIGGTPVAGYVSQGCLPASLYSPDSFNTPNGYALPYYGPLGTIGLPVFIQRNPYVNTYQSRNLREIETHLTPNYQAKADVLELQWKLDLTHSLSLASETGYSRDHIFSFEDYNRFDTTPGVFDPGGRDGNQFDIVDQNGVFCDPQLGCTNRLAAGDLSQAHSQQFSQEFRLSSDFEGPLNFSLGANFLRYDTVEDYFVFINTLTMWEAVLGDQELGATWQPGVSDNGQCFARSFYGPVNSDPNQFYNVTGCAYIDPNDIHHLNGQGRNYFLSRNPYHLISYAAFGEAYYQIAPNLKLTAGLRWTDDRKVAAQVPSWLLAGGNNGYDPTSGTYGLPNRKIIGQEWREPTGRIALDWKPDLSFTDQTLIYGSYVRGYKAGGANPPPAAIVFAGVCPPQCDDFGNPTGAGVVAASLTHPETFKPEFVNAYEIGTKNIVLGGRLTANLSAFYYDYTGYQISEIVDRSALNLNFDAKVWGAELELDWRPLENLRVGFKGGYENTRVADGMKAIDLMDRTAGKPGWMVYRPFPTLTSNCVIPISYAAITVPGNVGTEPWPTGVCAAYIIGVDPVTYLPYVPNPTESVAGPIPPGYPGYDPTQANRGEGFEKDLSGHQLPNAPKFTTTITADYTIPLADDWLVTLHADLYRQSEAWTRIFNDPGYDKLKAYTNVNAAAIFSNDDAGWQVMAYVKNVFNKDNITGAFLNSDDTGLTTNVFLNEPRLYGLRVTKNWSGGAWSLLQPTFPLIVQIGAQGQRTHAPTQGLTPFADAFSPALDPRAAENVHFGWSYGREARLIYHPQGTPWRIEAGFRYGRTDRETASLRREEVAGPRVCSAPFTGPYGGAGHRRCDPDGSNYNRIWFTTPYSRMGTTISRMEDHVVADFAVGRDVGIGVLDIAQRISGGLMVAKFRSSVSGNLVGVTDLHVPDGWQFARFFSNPAYQSSFHHEGATFDGKQEFSGAGPVISWDGSRDLLGDSDAGRLSAEGGITAGVLFGRQTSRTKGVGGDTAFVGAYPVYSGGEWGNGGLPPVVSSPIDIRHSRSVTAPMAGLNLGVAYQIPGVKLDLGYRWERYFNVIGVGGRGDRSEDRTFDGPYFKIAVGFGG